MALISVSVSDIFCPPKKEYSSILLLIKVCAFLILVKNLSIFFGVIKSFFCHKEITVAKVKAKADKVKKIFNCLL